MFDICLQTETLLDSKAEVSGTYTTYRGTKGYIEPEYEVSAEKGRQGWKVTFTCLNYPDEPVHVGVPYDVCKWKSSAIEIAVTTLKLGQEAEKVEGIL